MKKRTSFGVKFDSITYAGLKQEISRSVAAREPVNVGYMNLHGAFLHLRDTRFRQFFEGARIVYADGFPIVFWRRLLWGDVSSDMRFSLTHELPDFFAFCRDRRLSVYYVGSEAAVARAGIDRFVRDIPGLRLGGCGGFFDMARGSAGSQAILKEIEGFAPDILFLGMGMPRQEIWAADNRDAIAAPVVYACGAAIEYYAGHAARPPVWLAAAGLGWLFRLVHEPRKLWFRYLVEPLFLLPAMGRELAARVAAFGR